MNAFAFLNSGNSRQSSTKQQYIFLFMEYKAVFEAERYYNDIDMTAIINIPHC